MAKELITSAHLNLFRRADGKPFLPDEIVNEVPASLPAFHGFDERNVACPTATKNIETEEYEGLFKIAQNHADIFTDYNEGVGTAFDGYERRKWGTKIARSHVKMDTALFNRPAAGITGWEIAKQDRITDTIMSLEKQFFYGDPKVGGKGDIQKGFQGLQKFVKPSMTLDAGGTGPERCSAYLVYFNQTRGVSWLMGKNGVMQFGEERVETAYDKNKGEYDVIKQTYEFFPGLAMQGVYTVLRIKNIDVSTADNFTNKNQSVYGRNDFVRTFEVSDQQAERMFYHQKGCHDAWSKPQTDHDFR
ncbi:MAG: phage major capsid protein [Thermoguttaceae bacterium]